MATFRAAIIFPWDVALFSFYELYSMGIPVIMPDHKWGLRYHNVPNPFVLNSGGKFEKTKMS